MKKAGKKLTPAPRQFPLAESLVPTSALCERTFVNSSGAPALTVRSVLRPAGAPGTPASYRVTVTRAEGAPATPSYSLYTLCIQGRKWRVEVTQASGESVAFIDAKGAVAREISGLKQPVNLILSRAQPKNSPDVDPAKLWFLKFAGDSCELWLTSFRPKQSKARRPGDGTDDGSCPPPPESGGEDGEAE